MSTEKRNEWIFGLSLIGILVVFFCISTFDFPKSTPPTATSWPTIDARTVDLKSSLLVSDDFVDYCCGDFIMSSLVISMMDYQVKNLLLN